MGISFIRPLVLTTLSRQIMTNAQLMDLLGIAWGIIANAGGGNWETQPQEWRIAAMRWREQYHKALSEFVDSSDKGLSNE
jgi:hypothetical protein